MPQYDLLIKSGEVIDPATRRRGQFDVAISGGTIAAIAPLIPASDATQVIDAQHKLIVPGLIDLHTHLGFELHTHVVQPDAICPRTGVATAIDMGSTGAFTFPWYRDRVLSATPVRLREFLNIASIGTIAIHNPYYVDNYGRYIDVTDTIRMINENRHYIWGIKVFTTSAMVGQWAIPALQAARQVADEVNLPIAAHVSVAPPTLEEVLPFLHAGDIMTHTFTPHNQGILDEQGRLKPAVREARERGVLFDLGHGAGSFTFEVARKALDQGFLPDAISTDIYYANIEGPVKDLPTTMSKLLNLGLPLEDVIARVTCNPARAVRQNTLGTLQPGAPADVTLLTLQEGQFIFQDARKQSLEGRWNLACHMTIFGGRIVYA
jgi:dihydroorotase